MKRPLELGLGAQLYHHVLILEIGAFCHPSLNIWGIES